MISIIAAKSAVVILPGTGASFARLFATNALMLNS